MKQLLVVGALAALVTAAIFVAMADARQPSTPTTQPAQVMADSIALDTNTPRPTKTPKPEATATPDMLLLAQSTRAALDVELAQARNTAEMAAVTATAIIAEVRATETRRAQYVDGTETAAAEQKTARAYATRQSVMASMATVDRSMTLTPAAIAAHRDEIINEFLPVFGCVVSIGLVGLFVLLAYGIARILSAKHLVIAEELLTNREAREYEQERENPEPKFEYSARDTYPAGISRQLLNSIATDEQLAYLAGSVLAGKSLTHNNFTPAEKLLSEGRFTSLQVMLVQYGYAVWADPTHKAGVNLTERGWQLMKALNHLPTRGGSPETGGNAG